MADTKAPKMEAKLNRDGIVSDRRLWLEKDGLTMTDKQEDGRFGLAGNAGVLIPNAEVQRLGLKVEGGKIAQDMDAARGKGGSAAGPTPQSADWPPSVDENGKEIGLDEPEWDPQANAPKSDFRHDEHAIRRALPTQGVVPLPVGELKAIEERATDEAIELAHAKAPVMGGNPVKEAELKAEGKSGKSKAQRRSGK